MDNHYDGSAVLICPAQARQREILLAVHLRTTNDHGVIGWEGWARSQDGHALSVAMNFNRLKLRLSDGREGEVFLSGVTVNGSGIAEATIVGRGYPPYGATG